jgi:protein disulfide-isomerase
MRHAAIYFVLFTLTSCWVLPSNAQIAWEGKLRDAHTKAKQEGKLMLLHFYTDNCVYCDRLEAGAFRSASVSQSINKNFVAVKVHGAKNPQLAAMFKVTKFPTDVIVTTDGKALSHSVSPQQPDRYIAMLTDAQVNHAKSKTALANQQPPPAATLAEASPPTSGGVMPDGQPGSARQASAASSGGFDSPADTADARSMVSGEMPVQVPVPAEGNENIIPSKTDLTSPATTATAAVASTGKSQQNGFVTPEAGKVNATPVGARSADGLKTSLASSRSNRVQQSAMDLPTSFGEPDGQAADENPDKPELAIQGFCAVSVVNKGQWVEGKPELGVIHLGKLYLFADQASMQTFLSDPIPFTPMLNEIDVVRFFDDKEIVAGKREWGVIDPVHNRMFFFADEAAMLHFEESFERYLEASVEVMNRAIEQSNPGV